MAKSLGVTFVLGFLVTGLGHIYLGYIGRGILFIIGAFLIVGFNYSSFQITLLLLLPYHALILFDLYRLYQKGEESIVQKEILCAKCDFTNDQDSEFCIKCGSRIKDSCPKCGQLTTPQMSFCGKCGNALTISSEEKFHNDKEGL